MANDLVIRTSDEHWLARLAEAYKHKRDSTLINDAHLHIDPRTQTIFQMGKEVGLTYLDWKRVAGCAGVSALGVGLIALAILDPEPTSKLTLIVATGAFCVVSGAGGAIYLITGLKPPSVEHSGITFKMYW